MTPLQRAQAAYDRSIQLSAASPRPDDAVRSTVIAEIAREIQEAEARGAAAQKSGTWTGTGILSVVTDTQTKTGSGV